MRKNLLLVALILSGGLHFLILNLIHLSIPTHQRTIKLNLDLSIAQERTPPKEEKEEQREKQERKKTKEIKRKNRVKKPSKNSKKTKKKKTFLRNAKSRKEKKEKVKETTIQKSRPQRNNKTEKEKPETKNNQKKNLPDTATDSKEAPKTDVKKTQKVKTEKTNGAEKKEKEKKHLLSKYTAAVISEIERHKYYPLIARRMGIEGKVKVLLKINRSGKLISTEYIEFSSPILKKGVEKTLRKCKFPPPPEGLKEVTIPVDVVFKLTGS